MMGAKMFDMKGKKSPLFFLNFKKSFENMYL